MPLQESLPGLLDSIGKLRPSGQTALGPALLLAVSMVGGGAIASKVIVCTDGRSNVGLGATSPECPAEQRQYSKEYVPSPPSLSLYHHSDMLPRCSALSLSFYHPPDVLPRCSALLSALHSHPCVAMGMRAFCFLRCLQVL